MSRNMGAAAIRFMLVAAAGINAVSFAFLGFRYPGPALVALVAVIWLSCQGRGRALYAHGTAREANYNELLTHRMIGGDDGVILDRAGYLSPPTKAEALWAALSLRSPADWALETFLAGFGSNQRRKKKLIRLRRFVHLVTFAPTGAGKSVSVLIPNLLSYKHSCVVVDPKGELYNATARHRQNMFTSKIIRFDPFGICGDGGSVFNPLALLDWRSPDFLDECRDIANMLIVRKGTEPDPHWNDMSELVLTCVIALVASAALRSKRDLQAVRDLTSSPDSFKDAIFAMTQFDHLRRLGQQLQFLKEREFSSVMTTLQRQLGWLDSPRMETHTVGDSFDPLDLRRENITLYLILPPDRLITLAPLMRLWVGFILRRATHAGANEHNSLLMLIDEAGHIGNCQALEDAVTIMRGYGIRIWFFFQSMGQLSKAFGDRASVFLDNIDTQQYFCINAIDSADVISRMIGDATIMTHSHQQGSSYSQPTGMSDKGQSGQYSSNSSVTTSQMGRKLFQASEILKLPSDMALVFHKNLNVIPTKLIVSYADADFRNGGNGRDSRFGCGTFLAALIAVLACLYGLIFVTSLPPLRPRSSTVGEHSRCRPGSDRSYAAPPRRRRNYYSPPPPAYDSSGFNLWYPETW